jgi:hypothetical protein
LQAVGFLHLMAHPPTGSALVVEASEFAQKMAFAAEWRFCIAPSNQEHKIYMTAPFSTSPSMETMENDFHQLLDRSNLRHNSVQCPTGANEQAVRAIRQHADDFNRQMGVEIIPIDWKPASLR